jgi:hypothetical protein
MRRSTAFAVLTLFLLFRTITMSTSPVTTPPPSLPPRQKKGANPTLLSSGNHPKPALTAAYPLLDTLQVKLEKMEQSVPISTFDTKAAAKRLKALEEEETAKALRKLSIADRIKKKNAKAKKEAEIAKAKQAKYDLLAKTTMPKDPKGPATKQAFPSTQLKEPPTLFSAAQPTSNPANSTDKGKPTKEKGMLPTNTPGKTWMVKPPPKVSPDGEVTKVDNFPPLPKPTLNQANSSATQTPLRSHLSFSMIRPSPPRGSLPVAHQPLRRIDRAVPTMDGKAHRTIPQCTTSPQCHRTLTLSRKWIRRTTSQ